MTADAGYCWAADWQGIGDNRTVLTTGCRQAVADKDVPEDKRCLVPGDCGAYEPGEPCCESSGFGIGFVTGVATYPTWAIWKEPGEPWHISLSRDGVFLLSIPLTDEQFAVLDSKAASPPGKRGEGTA